MNAVIRFTYQSVTTIVYVLYMYMYFRCITCVYLCILLLIERDWEDMKYMPEHSTLMRDFGRQKVKLVRHAYKHTYTQTL